ncbi:MAG: hypothetical protein ABW133_09640, partial [Polyangiaceae bacterium]
NLYFWISGTNTISSCPIGNCASPKVLVSAADMVSLFVDDSGIYWSTRLDTSIFKCPLTGCDAPERTVAGGVNAFNLASDETRLYYQNATPNFTMYNIESVPKEGSAPPTTIVSGLKRPSAMRLTGGFVYWSTWIAKGEIARCPSSGCVNGQPEILAKDQNFPINVEADGDSVFWVNENAGTAANSMTPASLHGCTIGSCPSSAALLDYAQGRATGINVNSAGFPVQNLVAGKDAVYYVADLRQTVTDASIIPDCSIRRLLRTPGN